MDFSPFLNLPPVIQVHAISATISVLLGPFVILRKRRDQFHKIAGYVWVITMLSVAISALFIPSFGLAIVGHFGPIHLFVVLTLTSLWKGMAAIFRGDITGHRAWMRGLYWNGLLIAGLVNFLPDRMTNRLFFPDHPDLGYAVIVLGGAALVWFQMIRPRLFNGKGTASA